MTLSSPTRANVRLSIVQPPRAFKTSRASLGPRQEGECFHQRWPRDGPRHSASSAKREAERLGIAVTQRLCGGAKLIDHSRSMAEVDESIVPVRGAATGRRGVAHAARVRRAHGLTLRREGGGDRAQLRSDGGSSLRGLRRTSRRQFGHSRTRCRKSEGACVQRRCR
jgi:hypothetical protein